MPTSLTAGVDLGTTFTCAAVADGGAPRVVQLSGTAHTIPSVVSINGDDVIVGEAAERRLITHPSDTVREFKRRFGDPSPIFLAGRSYPTEEVTALLLRDVVSRVKQAEGTTPTVVGLAHPASWGPFRLDLLRETARLAGITDVELVPEPVAAAVANRDRVAEGSLVAVYDLGGGTFDAAVVRCSGDWSVVGTPEGVERLGGIDFDQAVMAHVDDVLGGQVYSLDSSDPEARSALMQLRAECQRAKEHLSHDTEVEIPVSLPTLRTSVRLTRSEFEAMVRPRLSDSLAVLDRVVASAGVGWDAIDHVLLVGGSSNIPAVAQTVSEHTGRPVTTATNPHLAIAIGTAAVTQQRRSPTAAPATPAPTAPAVSVAAPTAAAAPAGVEAGAPRRSRRTGVIIGAVAAVAAVVVGVVMFTGGDSGTGSESGDTSTVGSTTGATTPSESTATTTGADAVTVEVCGADATGISAMAIDDGTLYVLSATGVATIDAASVASCAVDVAAAAPAAFTWGGAASHIDALGDRMAFGGPSGGALAIADRADVIECASFVGDLALTGPSQVFAITAAGVESVDVGGGTCTSTVEVQAGALAARHIEATGTRVVVAGSTPEGTPAVQMSIRGEWRDPVELPQLAGVSAIAGCGDAVCVFDTDTASMLEVSEDGVVGPVRPFTGVVEVVGSASDGGVVYLLARTDAATLQLARVIV